MDSANASVLDWTDADGVEGPSRRKQLGEAAGSEDPGRSLHELPAGTITAT